jgi:hypothetical protein
MTYCVEQYISSKHIDRLKAIDKFRLRLAATVKEKDVLRTMALRPKGHWVVKGEVFCRIGDLRVLTNMIAIEENSFAKRILMWRIRDLVKRRKEGSSDNGKSNGERSSE